MYVVYGQIITIGGGTFYYVTLIVPVRFSCVVLIIFQLQMY